MKTVKDELVDVNKRINETVEAINALGRRTNEIIELMNELLKVVKIQVRNTEKQIDIMRSFNKRLAELEGA